MSLSDSEKAVLLQAELERVFAQGYAEDVAEGDITGNSVIPESSVSRYNFNAREKMVFCGAEVLKLAFGDKVKIFAKDGDRLEAGTAIALVEDSTRKILANERVVLNLVQHLSGIATETAKYVDLVEGTNAKVLDTRKTIPGLRHLAKYAVKCGGGENHRMGLYDMVMIKDNHIEAAGGITEAVRQARANPAVAGKKIEVECDNLEQVREALAAGADIIMADNMNLEQLKEAVAIVGGKVPIEASGNVRLDTIRDIANTWVDFISIGRLTHSVKAVDIGLDVASR